VKKAWKEGRKEGTTVVLLIPARTDTKYFHEYIYHKSDRQEWAKQVIRRDPPGSIPERIEAIHIAQSVLGRLVTTEELYKWAGGSK
jgi:hypothetical protein